MVSKIVPKPKLVTNKVNISKPAAVKKPIVPKPIVKAAIKPKVELKKKEVAKKVPAVIQMMQKNVTKVANKTVNSSAHAN